MKKNDPSSSHQTIHVKIKEKDGTRLEDKKEKKRAQMLMKMSSDEVQNHIVDKRKQKKEGIWPPKWEKI